MDTYGQRILSTGTSSQDWEALFNKYMFESRFRSRKRVVDLGPGRCNFTRIAPDRIIAIDNSQSLVEHYSQQGLDIRLGSAYDIPLPDGSVDGLYSCWLLEHLDDPVRCLREIRRVLEPGGYACLVVPSTQSLLRGFYDDYTHVRPFTPKSLDQISEAAGFDRYRIEYLFWTRGLRRLIPTMRTDHFLRVLRLSDLYARRISVVNRWNLLLELTG
ncbi:class I SAM-dependent methyltransferase [Micromonospora sp. IBHARD004]|uniref:class I SAM-dependent methyltransferase n=1 Tax=Micromonospora sp. IBHARD004 TaxID=3457764 RepID=UPI00405880C7